MKNTKNTINPENNDLARKFSAKGFQVEDGSKPRYDLSAVAESGIVSGLREGVRRLQQKTKANAQ